MEAASQLIAMMGVLALLGTCMWLLRRRGWAVGRLSPGGKTRRLRPLDRLILGPQHSLHLVSVDGRALLVACSPRGCTLLDGSHPSGEAAQ